jgi:RHS repeat-associated protein
MLSNRTIPSLGFTLPLLLASAALAQTGVSDNRVSLPDGPGSLDGIGDNATINENMGQVGYSVAVRAPAGFDGVSPSFALSYSSGGGQSVAGIGWSAPVQSIERMTSRGLPEYIADDLFAANGGDQLVRVSDAEPAIYRSRFEGGFTRYSWHDRGTGDEGYWTAESPDGFVSYYGADSSGAAVQSARVRSPDGVFRYLLVETVDRMGHKIVYDYQVYGSAHLLDNIFWAFDENGDATQTMSFNYETRNDLVSDAGGGFNYVIGHRLDSVDIYTGATLIRKYDLTYEDYTDTDGVSRLARVEQFGADGGKNDIVHSFEYSAALGADCDGIDCREPYLVDLGNVGNNVLESGQGTLMDMNGDGLPDLIVTNNDGVTPHRIYLSELDDQGQHTFLAPYSSNLAASSSFALTSSTIQELDYDGDGFADLVDHLNSRVLIAKGAGDWDSELAIGATNGVDTVADFDESDVPSAADGELTNLKYFDYDGDRKIDILKAPSGGLTTILRSLGGGGYELATGIDDLGASFEDDNMELADINGDGQLDPVRLQVAGVSFKINLGRGKWTGGWTQLTNSPVMSQDDMPFTSLEDLNGDGIDDLVVVLADEIRYALNRNGEGFDPTKTLNAASGVSVPLRDASTTVLFADMNANGSNDVVWVDGAGDITYLELFPTRPHLMTKVSNGIGMVEEFTYGTSAEERARDQAVGWDNPVPTPMIVLKAIDSYVEMPTEELEIHKRITLDYRDAFYDGVEKQFRGFGDVTKVQRGDGVDGDLTVHTTFDLGAGVDRAHFAGLELTKEFFTDVPVRSGTTEYAECPVADVPTSGLAFPIRWVCRTKSIAVEKEGAPAADWVTIETTFEYDGYGNIIKSSNLGVTAIGGTACGAGCEGDEAYEETDFIPPSSTSGWFLRLESENRIYAEPGGRAQVRRNYYDGDDFVGLPLGQATIGLLTRIEDQVDGSRAIDSFRHKFDEHGNVVEVISPLGEVGGEAGHRWTRFDASGLNITREEQASTNLAGEVVRVARDYTYEPLFGRVASATQWYVTGQDASDTVTRWGFDEFERLAWTARPGDTATAPTEEYSYEYEAPFMRLGTKKRATAGEAADIEEIACIDGAGRTVQTITKVDDSTWFSDGLRVLNLQGKAVQEYEGWTMTSPTCSMAPPDGTRVKETAYDSLGRELLITYPDAEDFGTNSQRSYVYKPLAQESWFEDDNDPASDAAGTPTLLQFDGLTRLLSVERTQADGGSDVIDLTYDDLGLFNGYVDADGNAKVQSHDLLGRIVEVQSMDRGTVHFTYDDDDNPVRVEWGDGRTTVREYDELSRLLAEYDEDDPEGTRLENVYDIDGDCSVSTCGFGGSRLVASRYAAGELGDVEDQFIYDARGQLVESSRGVGGRVVRNMAAFDNVGRLLSETFAGGKTFAYGYDGIGRLNSIDGVLESTTFDERGLLSSWTLANGVTTNVDHNSRGLLKSMAADGIVGLTITQDRVGNILDIEDSVGGDGEYSLSRTVDYDELNRIVEAVLRPGTSDEETVTWAYDSLARLASRTSTDTASSAHAGAYSYGGGGVHRAVSIGDRSLSYDGAGRVTSRGDDELTWDHRGRLTRIERGGSEIERLYYGAGETPLISTGDDGRRIRFGGGFEVRDGIGRLHVKFDDIPIAEVEWADPATDLLTDANDDGVINAADAWLGRNDADARTLLRSAARRAIIGDEDHTTFLHADHLGSIVAATDGDGNVVERFNYTPTGTVLASSAVETERARFATQEVSRVTGYVHFGMRVYSPDDGRWLSPDPQYLAVNELTSENVAEAVHAYTYSMDNPTSNTDNSGRLTEKGWKNVRRGLKALAFAASVAAVAVAAVAVAGASCFAVNIAGAVVGGVVAGGIETALQVRGLKKRWASKPDMSRKQKAWEVVKAVAAVAVNTAAGALSGFATGGVSAVGSVISGGASFAEQEGKIGRGTATAIRLVVAGTFATAGAANFDFGTGAGAALANTPKAVEIAENTVAAGTDLVNESIEFVGRKAAPEASGTDRRARRNAISLSKTQAKKLRFKLKLKRLKDKLKAKFKRKKEGKSGGGGGGGGGGGK